MRGVTPQLLAPICRINQFPRSTIDSRSTGAKEGRGERHARNLKSIRLDFPGRRPDSRARDTRDVPAAFRSFYRDCDPSRNTLQRRRARPLRTRIASLKSRRGNTEFNPDSRRRQNSESLGSIYSVILFAVVIPPVRRVR